MEEWDRAYKWKPAIMVWYRVVFFGNEDKALKGFTQSYELNKWLLLVCADTWQTPTLPLWVGDSPL